MVRQNPLPGYQVTTPYGEPGPWIAGYHTGEDYGTHGLTGVPVRATRTGWVVSTGSPWGAAYGITVVTTGPLHRIQFGYCHLSRCLVRAGERVVKGQVLGHSGNTGRTTGPHLHYEERRYPFRYGDDRRPLANSKG